MPFTQGLAAGMYATVRVGLFGTKKIDLKDDDEVRFLSVQTQKGIFYDTAVWWQDGLIEPCWKNKTRSIRPVLLTHNDYKVENTGFLVLTMKLLRKLADGRQK